MRIGGGCCVFGGIKFFVCVVINKRITECGVCGVKNNHVSIDLIDWLIILIRFRYRGITDAAIIVCGVFMVRGGIGSSGSSIGCIFVNSVGICIGGGLVIQVIEPASASEMS